MKPRDRSLITVVELIASGEVAQMPYHLNRAMDNGLSRRDTLQRCCRLLVDEIKPARLAAFMKAFRASFGARQPSRASRHAR
ncbi:hypothetical protein GJR93_31615 [Aminobacter sp. MDW-2]|nr:hypothetical protein [Aminobacter sp. MDW-2]